MTLFSCIKYGVLRLTLEYSDPSLIDNMTHAASIGTNYKFAKEMLSGDTGIRYIRADSVDSRIYFWFFLILSG